MTLSSILTAVKIVFLRSAKSRCATPVNGSTTKLCKNKLPRLQAPPYSAGSNGSPVTGLLPYTVPPKYSAP